MELFDRVCVGRCGLPRAVKVCLNVANVCTQQTALRGLVVMSGNIDWQAHDNGLKEGGSKIFIRPHRICGADAEM